MKMHQLRGHIKALTEHIDRFSEKESFLVFALLMFFLASATFLSVKISSDLSLDNGKSWWALSLDDPKGTSLDFTVDNHSANVHFSYAVTNGKTILGSGTVSVPKGEQKTISPSISGVMTGRESVTVTTDDGKKKEVYREK